MTPPWALLASHAADGRPLGGHHLAEGVRDVLSVSDSDNDGSIELDEWCAWFTRDYRGACGPRRLRERERECECVGECASSSAAFFALRLFTRPPRSTR